MNDINSRAIRSFQRGHTSFIPPYLAIYPRRVNIFVLNGAIQMIPSALLYFDHTRIPIDIAIDHNKINNESLSIVKNDNTITITDSQIKIIITLGSTSKDNVIVINDHYHLRWVDNEIQLQMGDIIYCETESSKMLTVSCGLVLTIVRSKTQTIYYMTNPFLMNRGCYNLTFVIGDTYYNITHSDASFSLPYYATIVENEIMIHNAPRRSLPQQLPREVFNIGSLRDVDILITLLLPFGSHYQYKRLSTNAFRSGEPIM
jgi:hypothetical protein